MEINFRNHRLNLALILLLSLIVRAYLFLDLGSILGADAGRFAIISHAWYLKGITPDLRPYDMTNGFFYFPSVFLLPLMFEYLGVNSITTVTFFSFLFSFLGILVFYKVARIFLNKEQSIGATFFYSFVFDIVLIFNLFGVFPYGFASFFFLLAVWFISKFYFSEISKKDYMMLFLGIFGIFSFHWYLFIPLGLFFLSCFTHRFVEKGLLKKSLYLVIIVAVFLGLTALIYYPYLKIFWKYKGISGRPENLSDLLTFQIGRMRFNFYDKFSTIFFMSYIGSMYSSVLLVAFIFSLIFMRDFWKDDRRIWILFLFLIGVHAFTVFYELNMLRVTSFIWLPYSLVLGYKINKPWMFSILLPILFFVQSPSILYLINALHYHQEIFVPFIDFHRFNRAMDFIREEIPENATFLIDGGGAGCTGASASYGERIFPLTSRKIFYFTNYCWANYSREEFKKRVDLYRRVSINASCCVDELKSYNVTHVFIGEKWVGFDPKYFNNSNYELIYDEDEYKIYRIV